ncbi:MAG: M1 family metallopeptidase, partial [Bacteroidota bacterium]
MIRYSAVVIMLFLMFKSSTAQEYTYEDTLRGSVTSYRSWWGLDHYDLHLSVHPDSQYLNGYNTISYTVLDSGTVLQVDLQEPLEILSVEQEGVQLNWTSVGAAHLITVQEPQIVGEHHEITVYYHGKPRVAVRPPWDGGITWDRDSNGLPFIASSCQGIGSSIWWPCRDHMADEVDSMDIHVTVPSHLMDVSNGRLIDTQKNNNGTTTYHWQVVNPINNYGVNLSVGDYVHWSETYDGLSGPLPLNYFVLRENEGKARQQFGQVTGMLDAFEHWFGPYPFYEDGFKLVEVPYLGMEHQSAVTYGNGYQNGYRGTDLSKSGWGLTFDFIIIHESGHEWFANNITYKDRADMWIHESFTAYSESLYIEYHNNTEAGADYVIGTRLAIANDRPIIAPYGVNAAGSSDMYYKGSNMLHTLRQIVGDDDLWLGMLRGLNKEFYHQTVTTHQIEGYIADFVHLELEAFFDQYLRTNRIPILEWEWRDGSLRFRWSNVVSGFQMPVEIVLDGSSKRIRPSATWRTIPCDK